jgi:MFS family permease
MRSPAAHRAEHISIEAEPNSSKRARRGPYRISARLRWRNALRGIEAQFDLADDHHVQVRYLRPQRQARQYTVDLRFCAAKPRRSRHVAWMMLAGTVLFAVGALVSSFLWTRASLTISPSVLMSTTILLGTAAAACAVLFLHRTRESLEFLSVHGGAPLLRLTGGLGSGRSAKSFCIELIKSINLAQASIDTTAAAYLADTMREHHRLREAGALTEAEYEHCKQRILAAHSSHATR